MGQDISLLVATAATIAFVHTILGPDHYLPFIALAKSGQWSLRKTVAITLACGIGHVGSSVVLGFAGIALGVGISHVVAIESVRGNLAAWALIAFGLVYAVWGLRQAMRNRPHTHAHIHLDPKHHILEHSHEHSHKDEHVHVHATEEHSATPWALFIVFVLGPCEPLIPIVMYPAARASLSGLLLVTLVFAAITIATMEAVVLASLRGLERLPMAKLNRFSHALAGTAIFLSGMAIQFLGL